MFWSNANKWVISDLPFTPKDASASIILATSNVGEISDHPWDVDWDANSDSSGCTVTLDCRTPSKSISYSESISISKSYDPIPSISASYSA